MMDNLENILEGLLFVAGDGIEKGFIMEKLGVTDKEINKAIEKLKSKYSGDCGINVITYKNKIQMSSNSKYADDISLVLNPIRERNLSKATLETVAIIAYKQPITRLEIEDIRGVNSDYALQTLMNLKMIEVVGRKDAVGKPLLFGTTDEFLKRFDLQDLNQLPDYDELLKSIQVIEQESNHLYSDYEIPDEEPNGEDKNKDSAQTNAESTDQVPTSTDDKNIENTDNSDKIDVTNNEKVTVEDNDKVTAEKAEDVFNKKTKKVVKIKESKQEVIDTTNSKNNETTQNQSTNEKDTTADNQLDNEAQTIKVEDDTMVIDIESPKVVNESGDDFFANLDDEIPDFLKDEKDLQKI